MSFRSRKKEVQAALKANRRKGLEAAAITVASEAKKNTPVDLGRLRASIAWAVEGPRQHTEGYDGGSVTYAVNAPEGTALIGTNVEYAPFVHEGTGKYHPQGRKTPWLAPMHIQGKLVFRWTEGIEAFKFLEKAGRENQDRARDLIRQGLEGLL